MEKYSEFDNRLCRRDFFKTYGENGSVLYHYKSQKYHYIVKRFKSGFTMYSKNGISWSGFKKCFHDVIEAHFKIN